MLRCPGCGERLVYHEDSCPACARPLGDEGAADAAADVDGLNGPTAPVARFGNAAEAGFFADELMRRERIPSAIRIEESFDAVTGYWSARFLLTVPEDTADRAALALQRLVEQTDAEEFVPDEFDAAEDGDDGVAVPVGPAARYEGTLEPVEASTTDSGINWVPIVLTLAAGTAVIWGVREIEQARNPHPAVPAGGVHEELWERMARPGDPWVQKLKNGQRRELRIDAGRKKAVLREYDKREKIFEQEYELPRGHWD